MFNVNDFLQWERFITPSLIRLFYWLAVALSVVFGLSWVFAALNAMVVNFVAGFFMLIGAFVFMAAGIVMARIAAELILIVFRINDNLDAIRSRGEKI